MLIFATMKLCTVIYSLQLATICMGCGGRLSMRELERLLYAQMGVLYGNDYDYQRTLESMHLQYFRNVIAIFLYS